MLSIRDFIKIHDEQPNKKISEIMQKFGCWSNGSLVKNQPCWYKCDSKSFVYL